MNLEKIKIEYRKSNMVPMCIKIDKKKYTWMKEKGISPTALFNEALREVGYLDE